MYFYLSFTDTYVIQIIFFCGKHFEKCLVMKVDGNQNLAANTLLNILFEVPQKT